MSENKVNQSSQPEVHPFKIPTQVSFEEIMLALKKETIKHTLTEKRLLNHSLSDKDKHVLKDDIRNISHTTINQLVQAEIDVSESIYQKRFNSEHEFYGVLCEELDEVADILNDVNNGVDTMFGFVKNDNPDAIISVADRLYYETVDAIAELIQVAAVLKKGSKSMQDLYGLTQKPLEGKLE